MLRPERMSKVSVTGSKTVMGDVVETAYDLNLLHVTDYGDSWDGFAPGSPVEGAEEAADKLVTVRSIESILDVDEEDAGPARIVTDDALEEELEDVRRRVNELDDRRDELRDELRSVRERIDAVAPFADLGIDLDLLSGYDHLQVAVGEGNADAVERAIVDAEGLAEYEVFAGDGDVVAAFARPVEGADPDALADALVSVDFSALEVPAVEGEDVAPEDYLRDLEARAQTLESDLAEVEDDLEAVEMDAAGFLLAAEEQLAIEVQKTEAPLSFATTKNAFVAEGWVPTERYAELAGALSNTVGAHVEVEELERATFGANGEVKLREEVPPEVSEAGPDEDIEDLEEGESEPARAVADGGGPVVMRDDDPPVVQDNPGIVSPFEVLVRAVGRPNYREFDPTIVLFLTFPAFFGFMIGDLGYGLLYTLIGYYLYSSSDSEAFRSMGGVTIAAGLFTMLFGVLYGEVFGLHLVSTYLWEGALGMHGPPLHKGLQPATLEWAKAWLAVSVLAAVVHLDVGYAFSFFEDLELHGAKEAILEAGSWLLMLNGFWVFVFSEVAAAKKPDFLFTVFAGEPLALGFAGFSQFIGLLGLGAFALGLGMIWASGAIGEAIEALFLQVLVNGLSYTRLAAVLLAKAGMAFVVNLLFFGAYRVGEPAEFHFMLSHGPAYVMEHEPEAEIMFGGLYHGGPAAVLGGLVVLVLGHLLVLALGVTSAGLQAVRLEYYEFFSKFFEGGGAAYEPFGYERRFTTEE